jgi:putative protease
VQLRELEILAPAKNIDIGIAAIDCGADALYIAGPSYGAREAAGNPISDIEKLAAYSHKFGAKVYMVLNTILYDNEIESAVKLATQAYEAGCDALIIQDLGLLKAALPPIPLFASTQTNIRDVEQAILMESLGFKRAILARELSLEQISAIRKSTNIELESFVHGALCVSYSGQCYISSRVTGRSSNRGECAQMCRSSYNLVDNRGKVIVKDRPILSLKDLNLAGYIPSLANAGVTSFKIEGRLKGASYIKNVVRYYRGVMDSFLEGNQTYRSSSFGKLYGGFTPRPESTFNRGYTNLFIEGQRDEWSSGESAKSTGEYIGKIISTAKDRRGNLTFRYTSSNRVENGDGLCIITPAGEVIGIRASVTESREVTTNEQVTLPPGSLLYRNYNHTFERELAANMPKRLISVFLTIICKNGITTVKGVSEDGRESTLEIEKRFEPARDPALVQESVARQLGKTSGIYKFEVKSFTADEYLFYPISELNEIRRAIAANLESMEVCKPAGEPVGKPEGKPAGKLVGDSGEQAGDSGEPGRYRKAKPLKGQALDYRANISNALSKELYMELGAKTAEAAFEISAPEQAELMRCKYCIKFELGSCPKEGSRTKYEEPLWLENGGRKFRVAFDCNRCEMVIFG